MTDSIETTKILIVEDEALVAMDLEVRLKQLGYMICGRASTAEKALEQVEQHLPDLVMMDIVLQGEIDGIDAAELIRDKWGIPVVFLTAYADTDRLERAKLTSPFGYILKPFQERGLKITVEMALYVAKVEAERRKAESALKEREALLNATGTMAKVGGWELDVDTLQVSWTEQTYRIHEVPLDYKPPLEEALNFYHPDDRKKLSDAITLALEQGEPYDMEIRFITAKGSQLWTRTKCIPELIDGKVVKLKGTFQDITARKEAEDRLKLSEKWNREIVQKVSTAIVVYDADTRIIVSNKKAQELLGLNEDQLLGKEAIDPEFKFVNSDGEKMALEDYPVIKVLTENRPLSNRTVGIYRSFKNDLVWVIINAEPLRDSTGNIQKIIVSFTDITERRHAEESLRESERKYRQLFTHAPAGIYDIDFITNRITSVNDVACHVTGYSREEILSMNPLDFLGSASRDDFIKRLEAHSFGKTVSDSIEYEIITKSGASIWVLLSISFKHDKNQIAGASVVAHDITDKVHAEKAIEESEEKYRNLFNQSVEGIYLHNLEGRVIDVNEMACEQSGYSRDELLEMTVFDFHSEPAESKNLPRQEILRQWNQWQPGDRLTIEAEHRRKDGSVYPVNISTGVIRYGGRNLRLAIVQDITERKQAEENLQKSEARHRTILRTAMDGFWLVNLDGHILEVNDTYCQMSGYNEQELLTMRITDLEAEEDPSETTAHMKNIIQYGKDRFESRHKRKDGTLFEVEVSAHYQRMEGGRVLVFLRDISERKQAEKALSKSEEKYRNILENIEDGYYEVDTAGNFNFFNKSMCKILGYSADELMGMNNREYMDVENAKKIFEVFHNVYQTGIATKALDWKLIRKDGSECYVETVVSLVTDSNNNKVGFRGIARDVSERKQAEEKLRESKMFLDNLSDIAYMADDQGNLVWANSAAEQLTGVSLENIIGKPFLPLFIDDDHASLLSVYERTLKGESLENTLTFTSGVSCHFTSLPRRNDQGKIIGTFGIARDISESLKVERALQVSEARLKKAQETAKIGNWEYDISTGKVWGSEEAFRIYGIERTSEFLPLDEVEICIIEAKRVNEALVDLITEKKTYDIEFEINPKNRDDLTLIHSIAELVSDDCGNPVKVLGVIQDITEQRRVENEKAKLQSQLQQAQKMEAIGTLAGGVAHDFNNLLQAINGYTQLLLMEKSAKDSDYTSLMAIQNSGMRASELVRSLLLFSRKAETERKLLELNIEVEHARRILERTIPKMVNISFYPGSRLWPVMADPVQIEQILLNLGTNAADAMPDGGKLILETDNKTIDAKYAKKHLNAQPGRYVLLTISDTGHGMDRETQSKIFEPFFTTKEIGKGTGLGLASVYGIVQSHGGYIRCYSEVDQGTTFKIYFPAIVQPAIKETKDVEPKPVPKGTETILLVDDEEAIRGFAQKALMKFGYKVMTASTGEEALEVYRSHSGAIDLVITDIGMPGMGGHKFLQELLEANPEAKVIIASGYPINGQVKHSMDTGAAGYIEKPYQLSDLLNTVRAVLDNYE